MQVSNVTENPHRLVSKKHAKLHILRAQRDQMHDVAALVRSSAKWYEPFVEPEDMSQHEVGERWISENFSRREFYVGYLDGVSVGTISFQELGDFAYLGYIYLNVKYVGRGFGHQLMKFAEQLARARGLEGMFLIAHPSADWATKAYKKYGFRVLHRSKDQVLSWKDGILKPYYEEGFELYTYPFANESG